MPKWSSRLTFETIKVVHQVLKKRNMTIVSNEIGMTQPAVTFHVRKFEEIFGRKIISRVGNKLVAGEDAVRVMEICEAILKRSDELTELKRSPWSKRRRIGICYSAFSVLMSRGVVIVDLLDRFQITVSAPAELSERFNSGELHAVFRPVHPKEARPDLVIEVPLSWVASRQLRFSSEVADPVPIILEGPKSASAALTRNYLEGADIPYRVMAEVDDYESLRILVEGGIGFVLVPEFRVPYFGLEQGHKFPYNYDDLHGCFGLFCHKREFPLSDESDLFELIVSELIPRETL
ncbi:LysR family transcriptional regulator [Bosea sp. CS1GBMeth4]|uniref:LysR family transcriptional regulator n=1 Tax=Bosea sp. CS1GBMeth4 TaxID=1892849 RepID=UPI0032AF1177